MDTGGDANGEGVEAVTMLIGERGEVGASIVEGTVEAMVIWSEGG